MRPTGSMPRVLKMYTDSGAPVNLNQSVCPRMMAAAIGQTAEPGSGSFHGCVLSGSWTMLESGPVPALLRVQAAFIPFQSVKVLVKNRL